MGFGIRRAKVVLGFGERLVLVGHDVALVVVNDPPVDPEADDEVVGESVYFSADWNAATSPSAVIDEDGDVAFLDGSWTKARAARCPSEARRFERLFAKNFDDNLRVKR